MAALLLLAGPARAEPAVAAPAPLWVDVTLPARVEGPLPWLELRGQAGRDALQHDVVLAVDVSGSTARASGADVDGDGHLGRRLPSADDPLRRPHPRRLCSDPDDTVLRAEIEALRRLLDRFASPGTRVGLLAFAGGSRVLAPLGAPPETLRAALDALAREAQAGGGTDVGGALRAAQAMFEAAEGDVDGERAPRRTLVLLSDGLLGAPPTRSGAVEAVRAAGGELAAAHVVLRAFALGAEEPAHDEVLAEIAGRTGGALRRLASTAEVVDALPRLRLSAVREVEVANATLGRPARAVRLFADGSFDAVVPLAPGPNEVRVTARGRGAGPRTVAREVVFEPREATSAEEARAAARWLEQLRLRTTETGLAARARAGRLPAEPGGSGQRRQLELEARDVPSGADGP